VSDSVRAVVWLVTGAAVATPLTLALTGLVARFYDKGGFFGRAGVPDDGRPYLPPPDHATQWFVAATVAGFAAPVVGILLSLRSKQVLPPVLLSVVIAITALVLAITHIDATPDPVDDGPRHCQEHSGGDTTCPGG
jgi:xanthine/uracil permease